jgi:phenylpropionate dioxygenase-like ring-hydroxylating dioxygenase large terminal subunit
VALPACLRTPGGTIIGDGIVQCPYHGLQFDGATGRCVHNPHADGKIPQAASIPSYPLVERHGLLWLWLGDTTLADGAACRRRRGIACGARCCAS